jgi:hypothetical protein
LPGATPTPDPTPSMPPFGALNRLRCAPAAAARRLWLLGVDLEALHALDACSSVPSWPCGRDQDVYADFAAGMVRADAR